MKKAKFKALSNKGLVSASGKSLHRSHLHSLRTCISYEVRSILFLILKQNQKRITHFGFVLISHSFTSFKAYYID